MKMRMTRLRNVASFNDRRLMVAASKVGGYRNHEIEAACCNRPQQRPRPGRADPTVRVPVPPLRSLRDVADRTVDHGTDKGPRPREYERPLRSEGRVQERRCVGAISSPW